MSLGVPHTQLQYYSERSYQVPGAQVRAWLNSHDPKNLMISILQLPFCAATRDRAGERQSPGAARNVRRLDPDTQRHDNRPGYFTSSRSPPTIAMLPAQRVHQMTGQRSPRFVQCKHDALNDRNATPLTFEVIAARSRNCTNNCEAYPQIRYLRAGSTLR